MNRTRIILGFLLAAVFLYLFLRNIDLQHLWTTIRKGNPYWLLISGLLAFFNYFFRALRWRFFFLPIKKTRISNLFRTTIIGFAVSTIFPAKIGEVVRPYLLGKIENISKSAALATVVIERVFDTATILFLLMIYLVFLVEPGQLSGKAQSFLVELNRAGLVVFAGMIALVIFLYYLKTKPVAVRKVITKVERILPARISHSIDDILDSFIQGLSILHDPKILFTIAYFSIAFWLIICAGFWAGVRAYVPGFAFTSTFLIMTLLALGIAVPTPGGVGSYHLACKLGLTVFFNVPEEQASAIALVSHALVFIPITILGLIFLWREGLSAGKIQKIAETEEPAAT
jgi:uncharacterized protein (TIRG00374 family)